MTAEETLAALAAAENAELLRRIERLETRIEWNEASLRYTRELLGYAEAAEAALLEAAKAAK